MKIGGLVFWGVVAFNGMDLTLNFDVDNSKGCVVYAFKYLCRTMNFCLYIFKRYSFLVFSRL